MVVAGRIGRSLEATRVEAAEQAAANFPLATTTF
jgi:hypothetical protein